MTIRMSIWVTGSFIGWHQWKEAPNEVGYLRNDHRHKFNWRAEIFVSPRKDRQLEFHMVQQAIAGGIIDFLKIDQHVFNTGSCESIAQAISDLVWKHIGHYDHTITVDEDGECGSTYYFEQSFEE